MNILRVKRIVFMALGAVVTMRFFFDHFKYGLIKEKGKDSFEELSLTQRRGIATMKETSWWKEKSGRDIIGGN